MTMTLTATGDQGVELIAAQGSRRIAVQAKGFPSGNAVGNDAVLRVDGGAASAMTIV